MYVQCSKHRTLEQPPTLFQQKFESKETLAWLVSRAYLFQIFEEITESRILGEKEIVDFSYYSPHINYQAILKGYTLEKTNYYIQDIIC